jgi:hypothetical protein
LVIFYVNAKVKKIAALALGFDEIGQQVDIFIRPFKTVGVTIGQFFLFPEQFFYSCDDSRFSFLQFGVVNLQVIGF